MAKRQAKKVVKVNQSVPDPKDPLNQTQQPQFLDYEIEVERQATVIRAVRDVEIEHMVTELQLLRSHFSKEQLQKPVLQVFEETLPDLVIVNDEGNKKLDVKWKDNGGRDLVQRLSLAFPDCSASVPHLGGFEYSCNAGTMSFLGADNIHFKDIVLEEPSETQTLAMQEAIQTPGVTSQRLSVGMTPKSLRLPKPGEMLLSVHGSPLGVFMENNMEAIHESEED